MATACMPLLTIQKSITVFGGHLKLPVHLDEGLTEENGILFLKLSKGHDKVHRLLGAERTPLCTRPLAHTDIIETLEAQRNEAYDTLCDKLEADRNKVDLALEDDDSHNAKRPKKKKVLQATKSKLPLMIDLTTPAFEGIPSISMKCKLTAPTTPLNIEFSTSVLEYLAAVVALQIKEGTIHNKRRPTRDSSRRKKISGKRKRSYLGQNVGVFWTPEKTAENTADVEETEETEEVKDVDVADA